MELSLEELERRIADLRTRLPRHSVPPAMLLELEELEEERERCRREQAGGRSVRGSEAGG